MSVPRELNGRGWGRGVRDGRARRACVMRGRDVWALRDRRAGVRACEGDGRARDVTRPKKLIHLQLSSYFYVFKNIFLSFFCS